MRSEFTILPFSAFLVLLLHPLLSHSTKAPITSKYDTNSSLGGFLHRFVGTHKGNTVNDLRLLKRYLADLGYLGNTSSVLMNRDNDLFDDYLEDAVKRYQKFFNLDVDGVLNLRTLTKMREPRCGIPDSYNNVIGMQYYVFFDGKPKWNRTRLTYSFGPTTSKRAREALRKALGTWASVTKFKFVERVNKVGDVQISFVRGDHGDGYPFTGPDDDLAHAFPPPYGLVHFNSDYLWSSESTSKQAYDVKTLGLHELGHILGLQHSNVKNAIMFPIFEPGKKKGLGKDDINGIKALYKF